MIVKLTFTNAMPVQIEVRSNVGSDQPLMPQQAMAMTFELQPGPDGTAELQLAVAPAVP